MLQEGWARQGIGFRKTDFRAVLGDEQAEGRESDVGDPA